MHICAKVCEHHCQSTETVFYFSIPHPNTKEMDKIYQWGRLFDVEHLASWSRVDYNYLSNSIVFLNHMDRTIVSDKKNMISDSRRKLLNILKYTFYLVKGKKG